MPLTSLWSELRLNTAPFQAGLNAANRMVAQFGSKIASQMQNSFTNALSPTRYLRQIVSASREAQAQLASMEMKQATMGADVPMEDFQRLVNIADQFNLSLEKMIELWKENSKEATVFRNVIAGEGGGGGPTLGEQVTDFGKFGRSVFGEFGAEVTRQFPVHSKLGAFIANFFSAPGRWVRQAFMSGDNSAGLGPALQRLLAARDRRSLRDTSFISPEMMTPAGMIDFWRAQMLSAYRTRALNMGRAVENFGVSGAGFSTVSGYSGIVAAANAQNQITLLSLIEQHTRAIAQLREWEKTEP
jgi:hypothetical protein